MDFFSYLDTAPAIVSYLFVFVAKMVEVSLATVRVVLINRGEKLKGAAIGFFEVMIWVITVSSVLVSIADDPLRVVVYCLAFATGNYLGVILEDKLAIGTSCIQAVVPQENKAEVTALMRERGFGVTTLQGEGRNGPVDVLLIYLKRKCLHEAMGLIRETCPNAMITVGDVRQLHRGYLKK